MNSFEFRRVTAVFLRCLAGPIVGALIAFAALISAPSAQARDLTIDDILAIQTVDRADISPAAKEIAISMPRPAGPGEVYGRNAYEIDPSRNDIWLVRRDGGGLTQLTSGKPDAAGYWCPYWSPDGERLAMLSTANEGDEPHGGDNARLYVWERQTANVRRVDDRAVMAQVRYGSPLNEVDLRAAGARSPNTCRKGDENAPFLWLDANRLLAVLMLPDERSAMVDRYAKFHREAARAGAQVRAGEKATVSRSDSGLPAIAEQPPGYEAELVVFNLTDGSRTSLGRVPAFPLFGALSVAVSPDAKHAAVLAPVRAIAPDQRSPDRPNIMTWAVHKALYQVTFDEPTSLRRVPLTAAHPYPLDLIGWSPGSDFIALRARSNGDETTASMLAVNAGNGTTLVMAPELKFGEVVPSHWSEPGYAHWADPSRMLVNGASKGGKQEWRIVDAQTGRGVAFAKGSSDVEDLRTLGQGSLVGQSNKGAVRFDPALNRFVAWRTQGQSECAGDGHLVANRDGETTRHSRWSEDGPSASEITLPTSARILDHDCTGIVWAQKGFEGSAIQFSAWDEPSDPVVIMERNRHLAQIDWGERRMIDYTHADGSPQKMAVIFPKDYDRAQSYPTLFWVYGSYSPARIENFFFDPHMSAFYNLQLYASHGYVVVVPAIPIPQGEAPSEPFSSIPGGVIPALDRLIELGIAEEGRIGVFGQSFGGYTVNALIAQTDRFAAAASLAGATDLATNHSSFDPSARGWHGIAQDMAVNDTIYEIGFGMQVDPGAAPALYNRNSPLTYVDQINTPLLLIHGELDSRAPLTQPETLYSLLRRRGRTARLLRYWGENHSLANSPANVRDISRELIGWFDRFVKGAQAPGTNEGTPP